jgi:hypothetical protein
MTPEAYLKRYPNGPHAALAAKMTAPPDPEVSEAAEEPTGGNGEPKEAFDTFDLIDPEAPVSDEERALDQSTRDVIHLSMQLEVASDDDDAQAVEFVVTCKKLLDEIETFYRPNIKRWHEGHKAAISELKNAREPIEHAIKTVDEKRRDYRAEVRRMQEQQEREKREALAKLEEQERAAAATEEVDDDEIPWTEEIEMADREVREVLDAPPIEPAKHQNSQVRTYWRWRFDEDQPVINGVPSNLPREYLTVDKSKLDQLVRALKQDAQKMVPGIVVYEEESFAYRRG